MATVSRPGFNLDQIDDATAALIVQLQDDDVENLRNSGKGKGRVDDVRDRDVALAIYQQELGHWYSALLEPPTGLNRQVADRTFAPLSDTMVERDMSARGRLLTASSSSGSDSDFDTEPYSEEPQEYSVDDDPGTIRLSDGRSTGNINDREMEHHAVAGSSHYAATRAQTPRSRIRSCVACFDRKSYNDNMALAACGHWYCLTCLTGLFESALKDDSLFPPRCCRREPLLPSKLSLGKDLYKRFHKKLVEYNTEDKTYCCRPSCSAFIPPTHPLRKQATCPECKTDTCTICKKASHPIGWWKRMQGSWLNPLALHCTSGSASDGCSGDRATQQVLDLAEQKGWQRCFKCHQMVEMEQGCNHIR
ncbi:MAG: hypothetical protein LQ350_004351 [Teloschistes chrysophthalmus]|nr:MAG: hypothetical protein LQ350_004351 [Niorma chrysophthalma]